MEFRAATRSISSEATALLELVSGECGQDSTRALGGILKDSSARNESIQASGEALAGVRDLSRTILLAFSQLRNTVATFHALCTLTRIETSSLGSGDSVFGNLVDEVKRLSESIQLSGEVIVESSAQVEESIELALLRCARLKSRLLTELPPLMDGVSRALAALAERRQKVQQTSVQQAGQYREMGEAIDQLVTSLQAHDITRQQIEHVTDAMESLVPKMSGFRPSGAAVLSLQSHQLLSASRVFAASIERIESDLASIATRAGEMSGASRMLVEASGDKRDSFFDRTEECFQAILNAVAVFDRERAEMESTAGVLEEAVIRMRGAAFKIREIEIQIQRIAINAAIGAIHIGSAGQGLSRIAEVMQDLALESNINTERAALALETMGVAVKQAAGGSKDASQATAREAGDAIGQMRKALSELQSAGKLGFDRVQQIAAAGSRLSDEVSALRSGFTAGRLFERVVKQALGEMDRMAGDGAAAEGEGGNLEHLATLYTAQRERDVHDAVLRGSAPGAAVPEETSSGAAEVDDLANVEFF